MNFPELGAPHTSQCQLVFSASIGSFQGLPAGTSEVILLSQRLALKYNTTPRGSCQHFLTSFFQILCGGCFKGKPSQSSLRDASSPEGGASGVSANFVLQPETLPPCQRPHLRGGCRRRRLGEFRQEPLPSCRFASSHLPQGDGNPLSHRCAMPAPPKGELFAIYPSAQIKLPLRGSWRTE